MWFTFSRGLVRHCQGLSNLCRLMLVLIDLNIKGTASHASITLNSVAMFLRLKD